MRRVAFCPRSSHRRASRPPSGIDINVVNTPLSVVAQNGNEREPIYLNLNLGDLTLKSGQPDFRRYSSESYYTVPPGQRLVIEHGFLKVTTPSEISGISTRIIMTATMEARFDRDSLPILFTPQGTDYRGNKILNVSQPMRLYVFPDGNEQAKHVKLIRGFVTQERRIMRAND